MLHSVFQSYAPNSARPRSAQVRRRIGYCPQTDALPGFLTGREVLTLYARIRGIPENRLGDVCRALAQLFYFTPHLDNTLDTYRHAACSVECCFSANERVILQRVPFN